MHRRRDPLGRLLARRDAPAKVLLLQGVQDFLRALDRLLGQPRQARHLDAVAAVGPAGNDLAQEHDVVALLLHCDPQVPHSRQGLRQFVEVMVVSGEQRLRADAVDDVLGHRPGDGQTVERARASTDLIEDDEAALGGIVQDVCGLGHLNHEG